MWITNVVHLLVQSLTHSSSGIRFPYMINTNLEKNFSITFFVINRASSSARGNRNLELESSCASPLVQRSFTGVARCKPYPLSEESGRFSLVCRQDSDCPPWHGLCVWSPLPGWQNKRNTRKSVGKKEKF